MLGLFGLAAVQDLVDAELLEDPGKPVAGDDRNDRGAGPERRLGRRAVRRRFGRRARGGRHLSGYRMAVGTSVRDCIGSGELGRPRLADVARLVVEVLDADLLMLPSRRPIADDLVGPLVVDVDLERPGIAGDQDRLADRLEVVADRVDVERLARMRLEQEHRLVAEALVGVGDERRRLGSRPRARAGRGSWPAPGRGGGAARPGTGGDRPCPPESTTPASRRIGEQRRRPGDGLLGRLDGRC